MIKYDLICNNYNDKARFSYQLIVSSYYTRIPTGTIKLMGLLPYQLAQYLLLVAVKRRDDYQNSLVTQSGLHPLDTTTVI